MKQILFGMGAMIFYAVSAAQLKLMTQSGSVRHIAIAMLAVGIAMAFEYQVLKETELKHLAIIYTTSNLIIASAIGLIVFKETLNVWHLVALSLVIGALVTLSLTKNI